jgi:hypothetical protein
MLWTTVGSEILTVLVRAKRFGINALILGAADGIFVKLS